MSWWMTFGSYIYICTIGSSRESLRRRPPTSHNLTRGPSFTRASVLKSGSRATTTTIPDRPELCRKVVGRSFRPCDGVKKKHKSPTGKSPPKIVMIRLRPPRTMETEKKPDGRSDLEIGFGNRKDFRAFNIVRTSFVRRLGYRWYSL